MIESVTGETKFHGPSVGYGIPADRSLTNPLQPAYGYEDSAVIEQAELDGSIALVYTEHKVTTFPFAVKKVNGEWVRADGKPPSFTVKIRRD